MLNLYVVNRAGSFSRHAVDMPSLCEYHDLYGVNTTISIVASRSGASLSTPGPGVQGKALACQLYSALFGTTERNDGTQENLTLC